MSKFYQDLYWFDNIKVGDWVWDAWYGNVRVIDINKEDPYPITVIYHDNDTRSFNLRGYLINRDRYRRLYPKDPFTVIKDLKTEIDSIFKERWMMVSSTGEDWWKRRVFMVKKGKYFAWCTATDDVTADEELDYVVWNYAKELPPTIELTREEIANKFGIDIEKLVIKD